MGAGEEDAVSREVLGPAEDLEDRRGAGALPEPRAVVEDLDAPAPDQPPPSPSRPPARDQVGVAWRWATSNRTWLAAAAVVAVVGGLLGAGLGERARDAQARSTVTLLADLTYGDGFMPGAEVRLGLVVANAAAAPVTVEDVAFTGGVLEAELTEPITVPPAASVEADVVLTPDCGQGGRLGGLRLVVSAADGTRHTVEPGRLLGTGARVGGALGELCEYPRQDVEAWQTSVDDDGRLSLSLFNDTGEPVDLTVKSPPGTVIAGEPGLPATLPTDRTVTVRLDVVVERCTSAAQRADAGAHVQFLVDGEHGRVFPEWTRVVGWFAQRVQEACG